MAKQDPRMHLLFFFFVGIMLLTTPFSLPSFDSLTAHEMKAVLSLTFALLVKEMSGGKSFPYPPVKGCSQGGSQGGFSALIVQVNHF